MSTPPDLRAIAAAAAAGHVKLLQLWRAWGDTGAQSPEAAVAVAEALIGMARLEEALGVLRLAGDGVRPRQLRALAMSKAGRVDEAIQELLILREQGPLDAETGGLLGSCYKQRGLDHDNPADLQASYQLYLETYQATGNSYPGINAASLALMLGEPEASARLAAEVLTKVTLPPEQMDVWTFATRGEAHLLLGDLPNARTWYRRAVGAKPNAVRSIASMRRQARTNLAALGLDAAALDAVLAVRKVAAFTGHMVDARGRTTERFPARAEGEVRLAIRQRLKQLGIGFGFSSAARGSDVLFLEELLERGGTAHVVLPFPLERFLETSVGPEWQRRVEQILADPRVTVTVIGEAPAEAELEAAYQACGEAVAREARRFAAQLGEEPLLLAVWDGKPGDGLGGTADTIRAWEASGHRTEVIPLPGAKGTPEAPPGKPTTTKRGISMAESSEPKFEYANRHCLCIGIRDYRGAFWAPLPNARHDAEAVGQLLAGQQGFVDPLYLLDGDATLQAIAAAITGKLQSRAGEDDLVVVFFAGHGHTKRLGGQEHGFIVPTGATGDAPTDLISVNQLTEWSTYLECRHLLYIFDSCFSGMFQRMAGGDRMNPDVSRARLAITSGTAEQVVYDGGGAGNHSAFTGGLLRALGEGIGGDNQFTATELYSFLRREVTARFPEQTPTLATLRNHEGGEILFRKSG